MDSYSISEAARQLGVKRQTIYRYIETDKSRFTVDKNGKTQITMYGMELLQDIIKARVKRPVTSDTSRTAQTDTLRTTNADSGQAAKADSFVTDADTMRTLHKRVTLLEDTIASLESTVTTLRAQLEDTRLKLAAAEGGVDAMTAAHQKAMDTIEEITKRRGIIGYLTAWIEKKKLHVE